MKFLFEYNEEDEEVDDEDDDDEVEEVNFDKLFMMNVLYKG